MAMSATSGRGQQQQRSGSTVDIEFVVLRPPDHGEKKKAKKKAKNNENKMMEIRRRVQLSWPRHHGASTAAVRRHAARQLIKLLRTAGLPVDGDEAAEWERAGDDEYDAIDGDSFYNYADSSSSSRPHRRRVFRTATPSVDPDSPLGRYRAARDRFTSRIDRKKLDRAYRKAVAEMEADIATSGSIRNSAGRRRRFVAGILSNVRVERRGEWRADGGDGEFESDDDGDGAAVDFQQQLIAVRRLSLLLDEHFDDLELEDMGSYWERCSIVLGPPRIGRRRRRRSGEDDGFCFTLHAADDRVTIRVPVDFDDEELVSQLQQNVWEFNDIVCGGDDLDEIFS